MSLLYQSVAETDDKIKPESSVVETKREIETRRSKRKADEESKFMKILKKIKTEPKESLVKTKRG